MKNDLTVQYLAGIIYQILDDDNWGDIDPLWFAMVSQCYYLDNYEEHYSKHDSSQARELSKVLFSVISKLKQNDDINNL